MLAVVAAAAVCTLANKGILLEFVEHHTEQLQDVGMLVAAAVVAGAAAVVDDDGEDLEKESQLQLSQIVTAGYIPDSTPSHSQSQTSRTSSPKSVDPKMQCLESLYSPILPQPSASRWSRPVPICSH